MYGEADRDVVLFLPVFESLLTEQSLELCVSVVEVEP